MADHKIKISGDFTGITQGFKNLSDSITDVSNKKHKLQFDEGDARGFIRNLSKDIDAHAKKLEDRSDRLSKLTVRAYRDMQKAYEAGTDPRRADQLRQRFDRLSKSLGDVNRQMKTMSQSQEGLKSILNPDPTPGADPGTPPGPGGKPGKGGFLSKLGGLRGLPGMGGLGKVGAMGRVLGPAGLAIGAGVAAVGTAYALGETRRQLTPDNLALQGFGPRTGGQLENIRESGIRGGTGFTPMESVQQAVGLEKATGTSSNLRRVELDGKSMIDELQKTSREYGADPGELTQMAGQLRNTGMSGGDSMRKLRDIFVQGTAAGVERARLPDWARQQVGLLEEQAQSGTASVKGLEALNALLSRNKFFSDNPQRTLSVARGLDSAFKQQSGVGSIAAFDVINKMTGGNMSPFQAVRTKRLGLFKAMEEMQEKGQIKSVGEGVKKFVETLGELKLGTKIDVHKLKRGTDEFAAMALALQDVMGVEDITLVEQMLEALGRDENVTKDWMKSKTEAAKRSSNILERVMKSQDAGIARLEAAIQEFKMDTGDIANAVTTGLHQFVDQMMASFKESISKAFSTLNPFNVDNMIQNARESLSQAQEAMAPKAEQMIIAAGGNRSAAVETAKNSLTFARQRFRETSTSGGDYVPGVEGDKEKAQRGMEEAKMTLENLLGRRFNLGDEQNLNYDPALAAPVGEQPFSKAEVEKLQRGESIGRATSAEVSENDKMSIDKVAKEDSKIRQEDEDKLKGKQPPTADKPSSQEGGVETLPGTNQLVTPMNRLKDSMDRLADVLERQQGGTTSSSRSSPTKDKKRIGN